MEGALETKGVTVRPCPHQARIEYITTQDATDFRFPWWRMRSQLPPNAENFGSAWHAGPVHKVLQREYIELYITSSKQSTKSALINSIKLGSQSDLFFSKMCAMEYYLRRFRLRIQKSSFVDITRQLLFYLNTIDQYWQEPYKISIIPYKHATRSARKSLDAETYCQK
jgi:hypothetical protein